MSNKLYRGGLIINIILLFCECNRPGSTSRIKDDEYIPDLPLPDLPPIDDDKLVVLRNKLNEKYNSVFNQDLFENIETYVLLIFRSYVRRSYIRNIDTLTEDELTNAFNDIEEILKIAKCIMDEFTSFCKKHDLFNEVKPKKIKCNITLFKNKVLSMIFDKVKNSKEKYHDYIKTSLDEVFQEFDQSKYLVEDIGNILAALNKLHKCTFNLNNIDVIKKALENNLKKISNFAFEELPGNGRFTYYYSNNGTDYQIVSEEKLLPQKNNKYNIVGMIGLGEDGYGNKFAGFIIHDITNDQYYKVDTSKDIQFFQNVNITGGAFIGK